MNQMECDLIGEKILSDPISYRKSYRKKKFDRRILENTY